MESHKNKLPSAWVSALPLAVLTLLLYVVIRCFGGDAINGGSQIALLSATSVCVMLSIGIYRCKWSVLEDAIIDNIRASASAIIILLLIGAIAGSWMVSGVVPTMIYYGLKILHPSFFLVASCVICAGVSLMTGSSWTTIATIGVALMGIGQAMGFPEGWIAGAIISGAYFGDKISLLSDTTVLASSTVGVPIFTHIRYMLYTTVPSFVVALAVFVVAGLTLSHTGGAHAELYADSLRGAFRITPWLLLVPVATGVLIVRKLPAIVTLFCAAVFACVAMLLAQPELVAKVAGVEGLNFMSGFKGVLMSCFGPTALETGSPQLDELVATRGMAGMLNTVWLIICAMCFGGVMTGSGMLGALTAVFLKFVRRTFSAVASTVGAGIFFNLCTADQYISIILSGRLFRTGAGIPSAEPLGRGLGDGLFGARAVELVRHDAGHGAGRLDVRLHALLHLQYRQSADVAVRGGSRLENQKGRIFCRPQTMIMETTVNTDLVIFDLDGTLLDTIGDLAVACNAVLALRGLPQHSYEEYCHFVGNGIMRLVERALPEELRTPYTVAAVRADFVKYYTEHIDAYTKPYDRIPELVAGLVRRGVRIAVASNKFQAGTEKLVRLFFPDVPFAAVFGQREGVPLKPDPAVVEEIPSLTGAAKERVLYVGDSGVDMQTAAAAGVRSVGVTWGFRDREELVESGAAHIVDKPAEILDLL